MNLIDIKLKLINTETKKETDYFKFIEDVLVSENELPKYIINPINDGMVKDIIDDPLLNLSIIDGHVYKLKYAMVDFKNEIFDNILKYYQQDFTNLIIKIILISMGVDYPNKNILSFEKEIGDLVMDSDKYLFDNYILKMYVTSKFTYDELKGQSNKIVPYINHKKIDVKNWVNHLIIQENDRLEETIGVNDKFTNELIDTIENYKQSFLNFYLKLLYNINKINNKSDFDKLFKIEVKNLKTYYKDILEYFKNNEDDEYIKFFEMLFYHLTIRFNSNKNNITNIRKMIYETIKDYSLFLLSFDREYPSLDKDVTFFEFFGTEI